MTTPSQTRSEDPAEYAVPAPTLVEIRLLDHFIVGETDVCSLAERGLI